ncbi:MAG: hypothetical protein WAK20_13720 [Candidatus Acidiferrum sp.]
MRYEVPGQPIDRRQRQPGMHLNYMERYSSILLPGLALALTASIAGCSSRHNSGPTPKEIAATEKMTVSGLPDFGKIDDFIYRGAQPKTKGIDELKRMGVDTIVDLRGERHGLMEKERAHAESLGMHLVNIPGYGWASPSDKEVAQFFALVNERPKRRIFIHCWLGGDRVGIFIAAYRIAFDGWTTDRAIEEMRAFHFKEHWHENMKRYVEDFPHRLARSPELAPYRQMASTRPHDTTASEPPAER